MKEISKLAKPTRLADAAFRLWVHLLALPAAFLLPAGCGKSPQGHPAAQPELPSVQVRTQTAESKQFPAIEEVVGTVRAKLHATIEAKTSGRITDLPVVLGQAVKPGELLVRLDAPEIKARLDQAEAGLQQADRESKRVSALFNQQAATRAEFEAADSRYLVAKGTVAEARALLGYVEILAPFEGVVTRKWVDVGDQAAPGKPLVDIEDPSKLQLDADVPEAIAAWIKPDARLTIRAGQSAGDLLATVAEIAPTTDPNSRTLRVKLDMAVGPGLMSGQFARLIVPVGETTSMRVPISAIVQRGQMELVFTVENQHAQLHLVRTGRRVNNEIEILSGLDASERVVIDHASQLMDGQPVIAQ